ncbi:MAG: cardiolipin synthase [Candidatus Methylacidiphilales bacterium]
MMAEWWGWAVWIVEWVIRVAVLISVTRCRPPTSAMAWLLIVFFYPLIGLPLYLLIGHNKLPKRRVEQWKELDEKLDRIRKAYAPLVAPWTPRLSGRLAQTVRLAERLGDMPVVGGNGGEILSDSADVITCLVGDIEAAEYHVHLEFYIFADDRAGRLVEEALRKAAGRGVHCRLIVDSVGSAKFLKRAADRLRDAGVDVVEALPVGRFRRRAARFDLRNHRKLAVFDGQIGYAGSQNIVDPHYGHKDLVWHDVMCRLKGPIVLEMQALFLSDWFFETGKILEGDDLFPVPAEAGTMPMQLLPSGPTYAAENFQRVVVDAVHEAEERIILTTPYLVPDEPLMQALQVAVLSGARVDVVVPRKCDGHLVQWAGESYYEDLLAMGVRLHLFEEGLLHAKTLTIDRSLTFVGSSNFDIRSFALNFEVNVVLYGEDGLGLRALQEAYLRKSTELTLDAWSGQPTWKQVRRNVCRLLSPLL